jgi:hypothetical protein
VTTDLADFGLIDPCGMADLDVTSIAFEAGWTGYAAEPSTRSVGVAGERFAETFERRLAEAVTASRPAIGSSADAAAIDLPPTAAARDRAA